LVTPCHALSSRRIRRLGDPQTRVPSDRAAIWGRRLPVHRGRARHYHDKTHNCFQKLQRPSRLRSTYRTWASAENSPHWHPEETIPFVVAGKISDRQMPQQQPPATAIWAETDSRYRSIAPPAAA